MLAGEFFQLLAARRRISSALLKREQRDAEDSIARNHHIIIMIVRVITDLYLHAVRFGAPEASVYTIGRPGSEDDRMRSWLSGVDVEVGYSPSISVPLAANAHMLQPRELLVLMNRGNRSVGMAVVKDAICMLRVGLAGPLQLSSCLSSGDIDLNDIAGMGQNPRSGDKYIPDLSIYVLQAIADVMKREQEALGITAASTPLPTSPHETRSGGSDISGSSSVGTNSTVGQNQLSADPATSVRRRLHELNAWLLAGIATDYLTLPPLHAAGTAIGPCHDLHVDHSCFLHHQSWQLLSTILHLTRPQESINSIFTTGRIKDGLDRLMTGLSVGFRLGREVTMKMANSAMSMQACGDLDTEEGYYMDDGGDGSGIAMRSASPSSISEGYNSRGSFTKAARRSLNPGTGAMSPPPSDDLEVALPLASQRASPTRQGIMQPHLVVLPPPANIILNLSLHLQKVERQL